MLLSADASAYSALVRRRWLHALAVCAVCFGLAAVIELIEYRLLLIAIVVAFPAVIPLIEVVLMTRWAKAAGSAEVRLSGTALSVRDGVQFDVSTIVNVRVQQDAMMVSERFGPARKEVRMHLLPFTGDGWKPLVDRLGPLGVTVLHEKNSVLILAAFLWGVLGKLILGHVVAPVLVFAALAYAGKAAFDGELPGWEAGACLAGALLALTLKALIMRFLSAAPGMAASTPNRDPR